VSRGDLLGRGTQGGPRGDGVVVRIIKLLWLVEEIDRSTSSGPTLLPGRSVAAAFTRARSGSAADAQVIDDARFFSAAEVATLDRCIRRSSGRALATAWRRCLRATPDTNPRIASARRRALVPDWPRP